MYPEHEINVVPPLDPRRLRHFHAPMPEELVEIDSCIARADDYLTKTSSVKRDTPSDLEVSISQRRQEYSSLKAPIRKLPAEIFCKIFELSLCTEPINIPGNAEDSEHGRGKIHAIFRACAVCYAFREIAISHGLLWSRLTLSTDLVSPDTLAILDTILQRSRGYPLTFILSMNEEQDMIDDPSLMFPIFERLLCESDRWLRVGLDIPRNLRSMLQTKPRPFSQLRILILAGPYHVEGEGPGAELTSIIPVSLFGKVLAISKLDLHLIMIPTDIHLPNLSTLVLGGIHRNKDVLALLSQCPNLKNFTLRFHPLVKSSEDIRADLQLHDEVSLTKLESFHYDMYSPQKSHDEIPALEGILAMTLFSLFRCLSLPALKRLKVISRPKDTSTNAILALLRSCFQRSQSSLERVELFGPYPGMGIHMLADFHRITYLCISLPITRLALTTLTYKMKEPETHHFPRLVVLKLSVDEADVAKTAFQDTLVEMLDSRTNKVEGRRRLQRLYLHRQTLPLPQTLVDRIQGFATRGLVFHELEELLDIHE